MDMYDKIDAILAEKKMSRRQLALAAGISENTISGAFRRRTKNFSMENIVRIADVLGVSFTDLVDMKPVVGEELLELEAKIPSLYKHTYMPKKLRLCPILRKIWDMALRSSTDTISTL